MYRLIDPFINSASKTNAMRAYRNLRNARMNRLNLRDIIDKKNLF